MSSRPSTFVLTSPGPLRLYSTTELLRLPPPAWLIDGIVPTGGLVGLYGPPGHGKSFLALDMALSVATGCPWQGRPVLSGFVLYVSAEGGTGIGKRVQAWLAHHQAHPKSANVAWLIESIAVLSDSGDMDVLLGRINDEVTDCPVLVVIDTLARCFDGDENQQEDMGRFIQGVDRLRREFGATVLVVHHTRLAGDRERGNTAFRGAADTMIFVRKQGHRLRLTNNKQKDAEPFTHVPSGHDVPSGYEDKDDDGETQDSRPKFLDLILQVDRVINSCVVRRLKEKREKSVVGLLNFLKDPHTFTELATQVSQQHWMSRKTLARKLLTLIESGQITKENGIYRRT